MTEESYQQGRKVMQNANYWRGQITIAKGNVAKWTRIEDYYRENMQPSKADGAKKMIEKSMIKLEEYRKTFSIIKFPDNDLQTYKKETAQCECCGVLIAKGNTYCGECLCED